MKRSPMKPRKSYLKRGTKRIPRLNPERAARRQKAYAEYLRSAAWRELRREALEVAGHRCEYETHEFGFAPERCIITSGLHVHHRRYTKTRAYALLDDLRVYCARHHQIIEAQTSYRAQRRMALARAGGGKP